MNCVICSNVKCFVKKYCSDKWIESINKTKSNIRCNKGQSIILEGSPVIGIYFIFKGKVKITIAGDNNKEQIVRLANDGHVLGHRGCGKEGYPIGATALEETYVCFVDNETLNMLMLENPNFTIGLMVFYSEELRKAEARIKYFSQMTVREKVVYALVYLTDTFGLTPDKLLDVITTRKEIAEIAGTTADQVSREITSLVKSEILVTDEKKIILKDHKQLKEIIEDYSPYNY